MKVSKVLKKAAIDFWKDEEAQGMIEYILILVAVVGIITLVGPRIRGIIEGQAGELEGNLGEFNGEF